MTLPPRGRFAGVANIVRFNWPFYVLGLAGVAVAVLAAGWLPWWAAILATSGGLLTLWQLLVSLAVSHFVYDRSPLYRWTWLTAKVPGGVSNIVTVHAGFDESSAALQALFPAARLTSLDCYDPAFAPEPSIERARRAFPPPAGTVWARHDHWPTESGTTDLVMFFLAAHELRAESQRIALFREAKRVLRPGGVVVVVEHLRDWANFLAYGPGALHFHARAAWLGAAAGAELRLREEFPITPFVRGFVFVQ